MDKDITSVRVKKIVFYAIYIFIALVLQEVAFSGLRIGGVYPFVLPACAAALGFFEGGWSGAIYSLVLGLFADLTFPETVIMYTVLFPCIAFIAGFITFFYVNKGFLAFFIIAAVMTAAGGAVQAIRVFLLSGFSAALFQTFLLQTLLSLPFLPLCFLPPKKRFYAVI